MKNSENLDANELIEVPLSKIFTKKRQAEINLSFFS